MARIRTIKPEFWGHPVMGRLEDAAKALALALLNMADDEGYFLADPALVRSFARPFDDDSTIARRCLDTLSKAGWIEVREHPVHGPIGLVINFRDHQAIDRPKASKIKDYFSTIDRRQIDETSPLEQGTGNREQGTCTPPSPSRVKRKRNPKVDDLGAQPPMEVLIAVGQIVKLTPKVDTDGREIRAIRGEILTRVQTILTEHPSATPDILVMAWENYLKTRPTKIKAPQYFFGRQEDQGSTGANWYPYAKAIFIARQQEVPLAPSA